MCSEGVSIYPNVTLAKIKILFQDTMNNPAYFSWMAYGHSRASLRLGSVGFERHYSVRSVRFVFRRLIVRVRFGSADTRVLVRFVRFGSVRIPSLLRTPASVTIIGPINASECRA
jgi:hypothetical protein